MLRVKVSPAIVAGLYLNLSPIVAVITPFPNSDVLFSHEFYIHPKIRFVIVII